MAYLGLCLGRSSFLDVVFKPIIVKVLMKFGSGKNVSLSCNDRVIFVIGMACNK